MKTTILAILVLISSNLVAKDCTTTKSDSQVQEQRDINTDVPAWLKGGTIVIRRADGKESVVSADKFKVVPRKQQFIVTKVKETEQLTCSVPGEKEKNRVSLLGGVGPSGKLKVTTDPSKATIETGSSAVGGLQYQRLITDRVSIGGQVQTNESALISIGLDF